MNQIPKLTSQAVRDTLKRMVIIQAAQKAIQDEARKKAAGYLIAPSEVVAMKVPHG